MYSVYAGTTCIYDDTSNDTSLRLIAPTLELADSAAGSFKMTVPVTNVGYGLIERLKTYITVKKDGEEMWEGRVIDESIDFWKNRTLTCEGELAYLNDSTQPPAEYHDLTVRGFLNTLLQIHNSKVSEERQFTVGAVTVTDPNDSLYRYTNYEKTIECINEKLVERLGGHLVVRKENGVRYLDYLADKLSTNTQVIEFGTNLLDYTASFDMTEYATVIVPLGERLEESPIAALEAYTTVASVNDGSIYVQNAEAVTSYGWIEKVVHFDRVSEPSNLLRKARQYLTDLQFDNMILEVKAVDLHYMNPEIEGVKLSDQIQVISLPHGLNKIFPVMKLSIPLDQPENTLFTLGTAIKTSLTSENNKVNSEIKQRIDEMPTKQSVLTEAQENAQQIMDLVTNGFITITTDSNGSEAIYISDNQDIETATRFWRWNVNGLAYGTKQSGQDVSQATYSIAMTMDGSIVADRITTGTLRADLLNAVRIRAENFYLQNGASPSQDDPTLAEAFQGFYSSVSGLAQISVKSVEVYYALGDSQTTAPDSSASWSTTAPAWQSDKYMWQKTLTIFADDTVATPHRSWSNPTCIQGAKGETGDDGDPGVGITSVVPEYALKAHTTPPVAPTTGWSTTCPAWQEGYDIWTRSHIYYDDGSDETTQPVLDEAVNTLSQTYTEIKQTMSNITLKAVSGTPKTNVGTLSGTYPSGAYAFTRTSDGYYTSSNAGIDSSYSYGTIVFNFATETLVSFDCISDGESGYDFGIISELDTQLGATAGEDAVGVFESFKNRSGPNVQTVSMTIPSGQHFITIKYRKDSGGASGNDYFKINPYTGTGEHGAMISIDSNDGIVSSAANIAFNGLVTFSDLSGSGTTTINGNNITTGTISANRIDTTDLHVETVYRDTYPIVQSDIENLSSNYTRLDVMVGDLGSSSTGADTSAVILRGEQVIIEDPSNSSQRYIIIDPDSEEILPGRQRWNLGDGNNNSFNYVYANNFGFNGFSSYLYVDQWGTLMFHTNNRDYEVNLTQV